MEERSAEKTKRIRALNDQLRTTLQGGRIMMTAGVRALPTELVTAALQRMRTFTDFNRENDPYGEHDCFLFQEDGHRFMAKIDYYDLELQYGSEDPSNPDVTTRVLTLLLAEEY